MRIHIVPLALILSTLGARACPVCSTPTGLAVRDGVFNDAFLPTLLAVLAPFVVLFVLVTVLHRPGVIARRPRAMTEGTGERTA